ncbi:DUF3164 family protein [Stenotrophomonas sp. PS02301]|uniref:DUF3164 family protein n=1 Tax=Stenotrophomonas sp. PS02301 TaxID=2991427 RepID=UPI00249AF972|nr:DUF3164 family protein [Stenotrophomonas sp. PS02301]
MQAATIPAGYRADARGNLVPEKNIRPIDQARDELVGELAAEAKKLNVLLAAFKLRAHADIAAFVQLSAEQYRVAVGGKKGNVTLIAFDGRFKIIRQIQESIRFDERLQAAKALIDACLIEWTEDASPEIRAIINDAFRMDQQGNIRTGQVLSLRRLQIDDDRWQRAMLAIGEAVQVVGSKSYVRVYERDDKGKYQPITLDMAGV